MVTRFTRVAALAGFTLLICTNAAARPPTAEDVIALADLGDYRAGLALSPDGSEVAVIERRALLDADNYSHRLIAVRTDGGEARVLADAGGIVLAASNGRLSGAPANRAPSWSPDGRWLAYVVERDGRAELWRVSRSDRAAEFVAGSEANVLRFAWLNNTEIVVETAAPRADVDELATRQDRFGFYADANFEPYYSLRPRTITEPQRSVIDMDARTSRGASEADVRLLRGAPEEPWLSEATSFDRTSDQIAWIAPLTSGDPASSPLLGLYVAAANGADRRSCSSPECSGRVLNVWLVGEELVFRRMEGHSQSLTALYAWNPETDVVRRIRLADEELFGCGRSDLALVCMQESALQPRRVVRIDLQQGALTPLYDPNPQWRAFELTRVERIEVRDAFGNDAYAHLVYPAGYVRGRRYPVVIVQYRSRGFLRGGVGGEYPIHPLAGRGYFVLSVDRPEWRGAEAQLPNDELVQRTELDGSENRMKQSALEALLQVLEARGLSDPDRIGITGLSDGAETVFWAIAHSHLFAAAVVSTPPTDPLAWTLGSETFRQSLRQGGMTGPWPGEPEPWASWWAANSTTLHADAIRTPLLMNLPESEALMGFPLATRLRELNRTVEVYVYPGAFHVKWRPSQLLSVQNRAMDWLDLWLLNEEHDATDEPGRRQRWRDLRLNSEDRPLH